MKAAIALLAFALVADGAARAQQAADCGGTPYDCAVTYVQRGDFARAIALLEPLRAAASDKLRTLNLLGIALTGAGRIDDGNDRFREALRIDASFYPALKNLAVNEFTRGQLDDAARHFEQVLTRVPADEIAHVHLGEIAFRRRQAAAAIAHYEQARARVMQDGSWALHYATCLLDEHQPSAAAEVARQIATDDGKIAFAAGVLLGRAGAHADAARFFGMARKTYDDAYAAGYNQALMLVEAGDHAGAIAVVEEMAAQKRQPAELYNLASRAYLKAGRIKEAYDALRTATHVEPTVEDNYVDLAAICLDHQNYDLGLEIIDIGLGYRPGSAILHLQRGVVLAMRAELGSAEQEFDAARKLAPGLPGAYAGLAMIWMQTGRIDTAVDVLREEVGRGRGGHIVPYIFAVALMRSGVDPAAPEAAEAIDALRASIRAGDQFAPSHSELGRILLKRGDVNDAIRELEQGVALDPDATGALYNLAQAYRRNGDRARATELLAKVSRLNEQERGDDPTADLKRTVIRIAREEPGPQPTRLDAEGVRLADSGDIDTALARFREAIRLDPGLADAHLHLGLALERREQTAEALAAYQEALRLRPDLIEARYGIASVCAKLGDLDGAIAMLEHVVRTLPQLAEAHYNLGLNLWNRYKTTTGLKHNDDLTRAVSELEIAVRLDPRQARFHLAFGQLLAERQELARAVEEVRIAAAQTNDDPEYTYNLALVLRQNGELDVAEARLRDALRKRPEHALARRSLGLVLRQKGDLEGAAAELRLAIRALPADAQGHQLLGGVLLKLDQSSEGIRELREAIRLDPTLVEARVGLAQALARSGATDEARQQQDEIKRLNAQNAAIGRTLILLQTAAERQGRAEQAGAISDLRQAVEISPTFVEAHYRLALALARASPGAAEVERTWRAVLQLNPDHAAAHYHLGRLLAHRGDTAAAVSELQRASELAPGLVDASRELARVAMNARDWGSAIRHLQRTLMWDPADEAARRDLAVAAASIK
jgi:tetratricopeptide (TPR) repeat protein